MRPIEAYVMSKRYTEDTAEEFGAVKGAPCQIQSVVSPGDGTHTITFKWENSEGEVRTSEMTVTDGVDGRGVVSAKIAEEGEYKGHLIIKYSDGSFDDAGEVAVNIPIATRDRLGGIKVGSGLSVDSDGTVNATGIEAQIDDELSKTSGNPVQNKVITTELEKKVEVEVTGNSLIFI